MDQKSLQELAKYLASSGMYPEANDVQRLAHDAGLDNTTVASDLRGAFRWLQVLREAARQGEQQGDPTKLIRRIFSTALIYHPGNLKLEEALELPWNHGGLVGLIDRTLETLELEWKQTLSNIIQAPRFEQWDKDLDPPSALLQAKYRVVPLSFRELETQDLRAWCEQEAIGAVRLYTGAGGLGKTRLMLEVCVEQAERGWNTGFLATDTVRQHLHNRWDLLLAQTTPLLLVLDYAESRSAELIPLFETLYTALRRKTLGSKVRIVLLARAKGEWWDRLTGQSSEVVGNLLKGQATRSFELEAAAADLAQRRELYTLAQTQFAQALGAPKPDPEPPDLSPKHFERVLFVLMAALQSFEATVKGHDRETLLKDALDRERRFWARQLEAMQFGQPNPQGLAFVDEALFEGLENTLALSTLGLEIADRDTAVEVLKQDPNFAHLELLRLKSLAELLHHSYHDRRWIGPLQPDLLGEYLCWLVLHQQKNLRVEERIFGTDEAFVMREHGDSEQQRRLRLRHLQALTVLSRLCHWKEKDGETILRQVFSDVKRLEILFPVAYDVAIEVGGPLSWVMANTLEENPSIKVANLVTASISQGTTTHLELACVATRQIVEDLQNRNDQKQTAIWLNRLGNLLTDQRKNSEATECFQQALQLWQQFTNDHIEHIRFEAKVFLNLSIVCEEGEKYEYIAKAKATYEQIEPMTEDTRFEYAVVLYNLGIQLQERNNKKSAIETYNKSRNILEELLTSTTANLNLVKSQLIHCLFNLTTSYQKEPNQNIKAARDTISTALKLAESLLQSDRDAFEPEYGYCLLAHLLFFEQIRSYKEARYWGNKAKDVFSVLRDKNPARFESQFLEIQRMIEKLGPPLQ